ncbi:MAG: hypothetical protein AB7I38_07455 [Dehalococcoidia bacterium]
MPNVQINPLARTHESLRFVGASGPAIRRFASRRTHERPLLVAGSLLALGLIPVAAFASRRAFVRLHGPVVSEAALPRNMEWYPFE